MPKNKGNSLFLKHYQKLNDEQKKAVDAIEGPVMVIAGPGTGKTQVLTLRIANILLKTDTPPEAILALTFTEKATHNMRQRLTEIIGETAFRVRIRTFHSFCNEIIQSEPDQFPHIIGGSAITDAAQLELLEALMISQPLRLLRPMGRPEAYIGSVRKAIDDLKKEGCTPEDFKKIIDQERKAFSLIEDLTDPKGKVRAKYRAQEKDLRRQEELTTLYAAYQTELHRQNLYDYSDMLSEVARALQDDEQLRLSVQEHYHYILVDEHQDTNHSQNEIVRLIGEFHEQPNIFVVGDLQQAIYRFQGASEANFRDFTIQYPKATVVRLERNYRSTNTILTAAGHVSPNQGVLQAHAGHPELPISVYSFSSPAMQEFSVASMIVERIDRGVKPDTIAILYRTNAEAKPIATMLERFEIPHAVESDDEVLEDAEISKLLLIGRTVCNPGDSGMLLQTLLIDFLGLAPLDVFKIAHYASRNRINSWDVIRTIQKIKELDLDDRKKVFETYALLSDLSQKIHNRFAPDALEYLVSKTAFIPHIVQLPHGERVLAKLDSLYGLVRAQMESNKKLTFPQFLDTLDLLERHGTSLRAQITTAPNAVRLMTVHKAKGLEFDTVFIVNSAHGHWDGARRPPSLELPRAVWNIKKKSKTDDDADMRNLFYVALTRARKEAIVTWSQRKADGKEQSPSAFILAVPEPIKIQAETAALESSYAQKRSMQFTMPAQKPSLASKEYLNALFRERGLSVTALNHYLKCPWQFFFRSLIQIPQAPHPSSEYGLAAHASMKAFFDALADGKDPGKAYLTGYFKKIMQQTPIPEHDIEQIIEEGTQALAGYHDWYKDSWHPRVLTEQRIDGIELDGIPLTGKLDKIELLDGNRVNVVDYKTRSPMSANEIMGKTKNSDGDEFRQLVFYKYLLDRYDDKRYDMETGEIDFLEPNSSGNFKKEKFKIISVNTRELEDTIRRVIADMLSLKFWNQTCEDADCEYCKLRKFLPSAT